MPPLFCLTPWQHGGEAGDGGGGGLIVTKKPVRFLLERGGALHIPIDCSAALIMVVGNK